MDESDDHVHDYFIAQLQHDIVRGLQTPFPPSYDSSIEAKCSSTFVTLAVLIIFLLW